jgi:hypothetical protein
MDNARNDDPDTSKEASGEFEPSRMLRKKQFIWGLLLCGGTATAREAVAAITKDPTISESIRRRASDLAKSGCIRIAGTRRCSVSNFKATVYTLTV